MPVLIITKEDTINRYFSAKPSRTLQKHIDDWETRINVGVPTMVKNQDFTAKMEVKSMLGINLRKQ